MEEFQQGDARDVSEQRQEFLEARASILGATDSPKILGLSRHGTALSVYNDKVSGEQRGEMSLPAWLGLKLQNTVAELFTAKTGLAVRADNRTHRMKPPADYIGCHLDFRVLGQPKALVECKTRAFQRGWGDDGSDKIPAEVWVQVQHEMMVTGADVCYVAVLFGHHTFNVYPIPRNQEFIDKLHASLMEFRTQHWLPKIPPEPTGHPRDTEIVKDQNPDHDDTLKPATPEQEAVVRLYQQARVNVAQAKLREAELKNKITNDIIGDAAGVSGSFGTITWKKTRDSIEVGWQQVARSYRIMLDRWRDFAGHRPELIPEDIRITEDGDPLDAVQSLYTTEKPGYRRIDVRFAEEEEEADDA